MSSLAAQLDTSVEIITPENIAFRYRVAGPFRRMPAYLTDLIIRIATMMILGFVLAFAGFLIGNASIAILLVAYFILEWFYGGLFETFMNGQTPGKRMMGIRVLSVDGHPITPMQAVLRNLLRIADFAPLVSLQVFDDAAALYMLPTLGIALVTAALSKRMQRLGDVVCGTIVVIEERQWLVGVAKIEDPRAAQLASYIPMDFRISRTLARGIAAYVDRRRFFSPARRKEVARHLAEPLLAQFGFPPDTSYDLLMCALYHRAFIDDRNEETAAAHTRKKSP